MTFYDKNKENRTFFHEIEKKERKKLNLQKINHNLLSKFGVRRIIFVL
jgi:copper oxidase (laccase) domain-containing protein